MQRQGYVHRGLPALRGWPGFQVSPRPSLPPGRFTVAAKGTVTVNCSVENLRAAQFAYGDPFCISLYQAHSKADNATQQDADGTNDATTSSRRAKPGRGLLSNNGATASVAGTIRSCAFGGRLKETGQRTFVYNKVGIRIGTFISTSAPQRRTPRRPRAFSAPRPPPPDRRVLHPGMGTKILAGLTRRRLPPRRLQSRSWGPPAGYVPPPLPPAARATAAPRAPPAF